MKFGNIDFVGRKTCNLGDNLQLEAIDNLYSFMGLNKEEIIRIPYSELNTWDGNGDETEVVLPINFPFLEYKDGGEVFRFSDHIRPIYLGCALLRDKLSISEVNYYKSKEPIGCRDEYTYNIMIKHGIKAWLNGCMTICLDKKDYVYDNDSKDKIYLIDVNNDVKIYMEKEDVSVKTQIVERKRFCNNIKSYIHEYFQDIISNAKLVITSRLHCACPCLAFGVPVILVMDRIPVRYSWIDKLCDIYSTDMLYTINLDSIHNKNISLIQKMMLENAAYNVCNVFGGNAHSFNGIDNKKEINDFYLNRKRHEYYIEGYDASIKEAEKIKNIKSDIKYSFWGLTELTEMLYEYFNEHIPSFKIHKIYDLKEKKKFHNHETVFPYFMNEDKVALDENIIFVTASAATLKARELDEKYTSTVFFRCYDFEYTRMRLY